MNNPKPGVDLAVNIAAAQRAADRSRTGGVWSLRHLTICWMALAVAGAVLVVVGAFVSGGRAAAGAGHTISGRGDCAMDLLSGKQITAANLPDWRKLGQGLQARFVIGDLCDGVRPWSPSARPARRVEAQAAGRPQPLRPEGSNHVRIRVLDRAGHQNLS